MLCGLPKFHSILLELLPVVRISLRTLRMRMDDDRWVMTSVDDGY